MANRKAVVLIDGGYFDHLKYYLQDKRSNSIDVEKLSLKVCEGMDHIRTKFYHANPYQSNNPTPEEQRRYQSAQKFQYAINRIQNHEFVGVGRVKSNHVKCPKCGESYRTFKQKGVDVAIALDLVKMARKRVSDVFILITGDEDFTSAVEMAQEELCNVIVYYSHDSGYNLFGSKRLNNIASDRINMTLDFLEECAME
ncbi:MAG: NYN domain-containing protein [Methanosarcinales archaeon]|jgi:uncharacterized LabA/DUF88 family protein|nr:NYN domain-containing protein [Methanosarcinales archaeon]MCK4651604.1 NYN domain-containing protein [Methanosarcinales archaeon]